METQIGHVFQKYLLKAWFAVFVATVTVVSDMRLSIFLANSLTSRMVIVFIAICVIVVLCRGDRTSLGILLRMTPSYRYWIKMTLLIGAIVGLFSIMAGIALHFSGIHISILAMPPRFILSSLWKFCIVIPILEEALYRFVLCVPLVAIVGPQVTIFLSGTIFAALHFFYGNPSPDNFIAGYFLSWAFLKSGSIATPILLHSLGNGCALVTWVIHWQMIS